MNNSWRKIDLVLLAVAAVMALIAPSCASIGNPSGGPRDETPPRFLKASPPPGSANVSNKIEKIFIDFNEIINIKDPFTNVVVSPPSARVPRVSSQGKRVIINFQDTLQPNTTYTINFGSAIEDNNESNPLSNFTYTFSTGPIVDSLRISGFVADALTLEPMQRKLVGVHRQLADSVIFSRIFDRVAKTDDYGRFSIEGLPPGEYRLYALDDTNNDFLYSSEEESLAFSDEIISPYSTPGTAIDSIFNLKTGEVDTVISRPRTIFLPNDLLLRTFLTSRRQQYIKNYERRDSTRLYLEFGAPQKSPPRITLIGLSPQSDQSDPSGHFQIERSATNDTLTLWLNRPELVANDTLRLRVEYQKLDSLHRYYSVADTLRFTTDRSKTKNAPSPGSKAKEIAAKMKNNDKDKENEKASDSIPPTPLLDVRPLSGGSHNINRPIYFETATPAARVDTSSFRLEVKVDTLWKPLAAVISGRRVILPDSLGRISEPMGILRGDSLNPRLFSIDYPWRYDTSYRLLADSTAIADIYGLSSGPLNQEFKTKSERDYCSLTLRLTDWPATAPAFVELLNTSDKPVGKAPVVGGVATFRFLSPGKYYLRVINDHNGDGKWQTGDIIDSLQPEESYYYPKAITIKANWNKDETWEVFATAIDEQKPRQILKNKPAERHPASSSSVPEEDEEEE